MDDLLAVMVLLIEREHDPVGEHIVDEIHPHGRGVAKIAHLDRRRTAGQNPGARLLGVTLQIDGDIDAEIKQQLRHLSVAAQRYIVKLVERLDETRPDIAAVVGAIGDAEHLEARPVVKLEKLRDLPSGRMALERRGEIGDPYLVRRLSRSNGPRLGDSRHSIPHVAPRMAQLLGRGNRIGQQREGLEHRALLCQHALELCGDPLRFRPVADHELVEGERPEGMRMARIDRQSALPGHNRLVVAPEIGQREAAMIKRFGVVGLDRKCAVIARERVLEAPDREQRDAPTIQHARLYGIDCKGAVETRQRLAEPLQVREGDAAVVERVEVAGPDRQRALEACECLFVALELNQNIAARHQCADSVRIDRQSPLATRHCFVVTAELLERDRPVAQRIDIVRLDGEPPVVARQRFLIPAELDRHVAAIDQRTDMAGIAGQHFVVTGTRVLEARELGEHIAAIEQHGGGARLARQHLVVDDERFLETPQPRQHNGAIVERVEVARIDRENSVADRQRIRRPIERKQHRHHDGQRLRRPRLELQRLGDQLVRVAEMALLIADESEKMQRVELPRVLRQHRTIDPLGLGDPALPMQHPAVLDSLHRRLSQAASEGHDRGSPPPLPATQSRWSINKLWRNATTQAVGRGPSVPRPHRGVEFSRSSSIRRVCITRDLPTRSYSTVYRPNAVFLVAPLHNVGQPW